MLPRATAIRLLLPLFFLSGATSLVYQTVWARQLQLVFGTSQFAISTVLAAFMGGLALGSLAIAPSADRRARPLATYGVLELAIGAYALAFPRLLDATEPVVLAATRATGPVASGAIQALLVGGLLLLPTMAMGATLPLLGRFVTERLDATGRRVGRLYALNTWGAVAGVALGGLVLLPRLGLHATTLCAAAGNGALGLLALALGRAAREGGAPPVVAGGEHAAPSDAAPPAPVGRLLLVAALGGFAGLVYEVAWFRVLGLVLGASVYAFCVMVLAFLVGLALGGWAGGRRADAAHARDGPAGPRRGLVRLQLGVALLSVACMALYGELPWLFARLHAALARGGADVVRVELALALLVMTPPALLMGAAFPFLVRAAVRAPGALGGPLARLLGANALGAVAGAALAGFVLLPRLQVRGAVLVAAAANVLAALLVGWPARRALALPLLAAGALAAVAALPPAWDPLTMTSGIFRHVSRLPAPTRAAVRDLAHAQGELLFYEEGLSTVVTAGRAADGSLWLANNGKVEASTGGDVPTQMLLAHLPMLFVEEPGRALVVGLAGGFTAGAMARHARLSAIDVVELEPAVVRASRLFDAFSGAPLDDPRVRLVLDDGRHHLLRAAPGTYDVVASEPSNPWITGVSNLFTREFFELGRSRLAPGGVWSQWMQLYRMDAADVRTILATFASVFEHVAVFFSHRHFDLVLIGSERPLRPTPEAARRLLEREPAVARELATIGLGDPYALLTMFLMDDAAVRDLAAGAALNTDDNMRIEYSAPRHLLADTQLANARLLEPAAHPPPLPTVEDALAMTEAYFARHDVLRAQACVRQVLAIDPEEPRALAWSRRLGFR